MTSPPMPNRTAEMDWIRSKSTANANIFGSRDRPGASRYCTICGANIDARNAAMLRINVTRLIKDEASFQADVRSSFTSNPVKVGRKADPSAPAAIRLNRVSLTRLAVKKASRSVAGKARAIRILLTSPAICPKTMANITVPAARAI